MIVGVNGTVASVNTAIGNISNGTLAGLTPGLGLINAQVAATAAITEYAKTVTTANPTWDTLLADGTTAGKDGVVGHADVTAQISTLTTARDTASKLGNGTGDTTAKTTAALIGTAAAAKATLATAKTAVTATDAAKAAATAYDVAFAAKVSTADVLANSASQSAAVSGLNTTYASGDALWAKLDGAISTDGSITHAGSLYSALTNSIVTAADHATLSAAVTANAGAYGAQLVAAADKALAIAKANAAIDSAKAALISATDATKGGAYTDAVTADKLATDTLTKTQTADATVTAAQVIADKFTALELVSTNAGTAITNFTNDKAALVDVAATVTGTTVAGTAKADVFYFSSKVGTADFEIGGAGVAAFGAGDAIVLGANYTYNAGALSAGSNSALEFFLVKTTTGTNIVVETANYGSDSQTATLSPETAVITLTGVSADHLSVANGVVSYV